MAFGAPEADEGHSGEVLAFNVRDVAASLTPCPATFQAKVAYWKDTAHDVRPRRLSLEDIVRKQERAQQQREEVRVKLQTTPGELALQAALRPADTYNAHISWQFYFFKTFTLFWCCVLTCLWRFRRRCLVHTYCACFAAI